MNENTNERAEDKDSMKEQENINEKINSALFLTIVAFKWSSFTKLINWSNWIFIFFNFGDEQNSDISISPKEYPSILEFKFEFTK